MERKTRKICAKRQKSLVPGVRRDNERNPQSKLPCYSGFAVNQ